MIMSYWTNLNERERLLVAVGSITALIYLIYSLIFSPLSEAVNSRTLQLKEKQETLAWMQSIHQQPKNSKTPQSIGNAKLLALIGNQLNESSFHSFTYQLQQTGAGEIQLSFERVPFNPFLSWLWALNESYAITLKQCLIEQTKTAGVVKLLIILDAAHSAAK